jgi:hypothetical protein
MRWILLIVIITGCGDTFESQLFLEGETDAGKVTVDATGYDASSAGAAGTYPSFDASSDSATGLGDSSPNEAGRNRDGDAPDATPDTSDGMTCDPYQCQVTCASQGKACSECQCV